MFTGIVEELGEVLRFEGGRLFIKACEVLSDLRIGDSIAVNGVCLTVVHVGGGFFACDVIPETLRRTNLRMLGKGDRVNLERAIKAGGRFGGHFVQGHIDGVGVVRDIRGGEERRMRVEAPRELTKYIVDKGFIAVDGVSLTVISPRGKFFEIALVPFTLKKTNLGLKKPGDVVNLEVDIIAKYVEKLKGRITEEFLREHGFMEG